MRNSTLTLDVAMCVLDMLGSNAVQIIATEHDGEPVKYGSVEFGQLEAGLNRLLASIPVEQREEVFLEIVRDEKRVTVTIEDVIHILFNRNGRGIPDKTAVKSSVCDSNRSYCFDRLPDNHDFALMLTLWQERFHQNPGMDAKEFGERITAITAAIQSDQQVRNLVSPKAAPCFPIILPQIPLQQPQGKKKAEAAQADYGKLLEVLLLPAVEASYKAAYPQREFISFRKGKLEGQVTIVDPRHAKLYEALANGPIVGILFPAALQGFSPYSQREFAALLPESCSLQGPLEMSVGETLYAPQLSRDNNTPLKDCSAVQWRDPGYSLFFNAGDSGLKFDIRGFLGNADSNYAGGVFFRG